MKNEYEINEGTLAIISVDGKQTKVLEDNRDYVFNQRSFDILDYSCRYFGSSYEGRKEGAKSIIGASYKVPIIVEEERDLVFFPTSAFDDDDCIWVAANRIKDYKPGDFNTTIVTFDNGVQIDLPISYRTVENQIFRSTRLSYLLKSRKEEKR
ncbi:MAG: competence protein ComK [Bacilli bacterium]|nr:competence protein ComK [Bacilli bacterium]